MTDRELIAQLASGCSKLTDECVRLQNNFEIQQEEIDLLINEVKRLGEGLTLAMEWISQHS